jgi:hypothetical protein
MDMRKALPLATVLLVFFYGAYAAIATAGRDAVVHGGNLVLTVRGSSGVTPKVLSKNRYTPVAFTVAASIRDLDLDEPQLPPLRELLVRIQNVAITTRGYPTCTGGVREIRRDIEAVRSACADSIVGSGSLAVSTRFPGGGNPIPANRSVLVINGGTSGGATTLYLYAYLTKPVTTTIISTMKIEKAGNGFESVTSIPKIANGAASVTGFSLKIDKKYTSGGRKLSVVSARCVDGKIQTRVVTSFYDGQQLSADVLRTCTSKP